MSRPLVLAALLWAAAPGAALAQLGSSREDRAACRADARRLCANAMPSPRAVRACILANRTRLSPGCRRVIDRKT